MSSFRTRRRGESDRKVHTRAPEPRQSGRLPSMLEMEFGANEPDFPCSVPLTVPSLRMCEAMRFELEPGEKLTSLMVQIPTESLGSLRKIDARGTGAWLWFNVISCGTIHAFAEINIKNTMLREVVCFTLMRMGQFLRYVAERHSTTTITSGT